MGMALDGLKFYDSNFTIVIGTQGAPFQPGYTLFCQGPFYFRIVPSLSTHTLHTWDIGGTYMLVISSSNQLLITYLLHYRLSTSSA